MSNVDVKIKNEKSKYHYFYSLDPNDAAVIFDFFVAFSRFEFALKNAGYFKGSEDKVEADWDRFCNVVQVNYVKTVSKEFQDACEYYITRPPKKQIVKDRKVVWKDNTQGTGEHEFHWVIRSVKYVRNNLFHGGKFPFVPIRDSSLLSHGLVILNEIVKYDASVKKEFASGQM